MSLMLLIMTAVCLIPREQARKSRNQQEAQRSEQPYTTPFGSAFPSDYEQKYSHMYSSASSSYYAQSAYPTDRSCTYGIHHSVGEERDGFHSTPASTFSSSYSQSYSAYPTGSFPFSSASSSKIPNHSFISSRLPRQESKEWSV